MSKREKIPQEVNEKREKINKWHSDNIVVEYCCLVQARLLIKKEKKSYANNRMFF